MNKILWGWVLLMLSGPVFAGTVICPAIIHCKGSAVGHSSCDGIPPQFVVSPTQALPGLYYPERIIGESNGPHHGNGPAQCFYATRDGKTSLILESHSLVPDSHDIGWQNLGSLPGGETSYECRIVKHPERCSFALAQSGS